MFKYIKLITGGTKKKNFQFEYKYRYTYEFNILNSFKLVTDC